MHHGEGFLFDVRSSLQRVVRNIEGQNFLVAFSLANYLIIHGVHPNAVSTNSRPKT